MRNNGDKAANKENIQAQIWPQGGYKELRKAKVGGLRTNTMTTRKS